MRRFLLLSIGIMALAAASIFFITRDSGPTHPVLRSADLPRLIPTRLFFADPDAKWDYVASSNGKLVAFRRASLLGRRVAVQEVESGQIIGELPADIQFMRWHPSRPLLRFIHEGHDWEVDPETPERRNWRRTSPVKLSGGWFKNEIATDAETRVLTWGKGSARSPGHMWLV